MRHEKTTSIIALVTLCLFCFTQIIPAYAFQDKLRQSNAGASNSGAAASIADALGEDSATEADDLLVFTGTENLVASDGRGKRIVPFYWHDLPKGGDMPVKNMLSVLKAQMEYFNDWLAKDHTDLTIDRK